MVYPVRVPVCRFEGMSEGGEAARTVTRGMCYIPRVAHEKSVSSKVRLELSEDFFWRIRIEFSAQKNSARVFSIVTFADYRRGCQDSLSTE